MKSALITLILLSTALVGCRNNALQRDIVKETYIHKYGVPVTKEDWETQGKEGQTVALRSDGVTITTSYKQGIADGPTTYTFPNSSTIHKAENYVANRLVSTRENFTSGVPMQEEVYEEDGIIHRTRWYEDGTPQANEVYLNDFLLTGEYRSPLNVIESHVQDGHGHRVWFSTDGFVAIKDSVQNGQITESMTYFSNGDPSSMTPYENGQIHGTRLTFLQGGIPNTIEQWSHGIQEGPTTVYQNGEKIAAIPYLQGKKHGTEYRYRDGSELVEEVNWKNDVQHGQRKIYIDGEIKSEWYHEGEMVSRTTFERMNIPARAA